MAFNQQDLARVVQENEAGALLNIPRPISVFQAQTTAGTVVTALSAADFRIESLVCTNVTGTTDYITVYLVPSGGSASAANMIVYQREILGKRGITIFNRENVGILEPSMSLQVLCGVNDAVNVWGQGYDYSGATG